MESHVWSSEQARCLASTLQENGHPLSSGAELHQICFVCALCQRLDVYYGKLCLPVEIHICPALKVTAADPKAEGDCQVQGHVLASLFQ